MRLNGLQEGGARHLTVSEQAALVAEDACPVAIRLVDADGIERALLVVKESGQMLIWDCVAGTFGAL